MNTNNMTPEQELERLSQVNSQDNWGTAVEAVDLGGIEVSYSTDPIGQQLEHLESLGVPQEDLARHQALLTQLAEIEGHQHQDHYSVMRDS